MKDPDGKPILAIIYQDGRVFTVFSGTPCYSEEWNFEHCEPDGVTLYRNTGSGGPPYGFCRFTKRISGPPTEDVWLAPGVSLWDSWSSRPYGTRSARALRRVGMRLLRAPRWLGGSANPFEADFHHEGEGRWCGICQSHRDVTETEQPCPHLYWCEECEWWGGPGAEDCPHAKASDEESFQNSD